VIQELKPITQPDSQVPRASNPSQSELVVPYSTCTSFKEDLKAGQPTSPTKSFLTQFPVVKEKSSNPMTPAKGSARKSDTSPEQVQQLQSKSKQASRLQQDYSIFDFSESRSETTLYDISKTGLGPVTKDHPKVDPNRTLSQSSNRWSSTKTPVTVTQQLPVSSTTAKQPSVLSYSDKTASFPVSYSHPVPVSQTSMKPVTSRSYPSYNISSSSGNPGGMPSLSGNLAPLPSSSYQKSASSSMPR
jgi:hypothetical protein